MAIVQDSTPESAVEMYELAKSVLTECKQSVRLEDLDTAIMLFREALLQRPDSHPVRAYALRNLGMSLVTRFDHPGRTEDLDEAISLVRESCVVRPDVSENDSDNAQANVKRALIAFGWKGTLIRGMVISGGLHLPTQ